MKTILYIHGFESSRDSYTGNTLKRLFPEHRWVLETFDLLRVEECSAQIRSLIEKESIDLVTSSSLGCIYNLMIRRENGRMPDKVLLNPCCFPSRELPKIARIPASFRQICEKVEQEVYRTHPDNLPEKLFGIFARNDELFRYGDFFAERYGKYAPEGGAPLNRVMVDGGHSGLAPEVLQSAFRLAMDYFNHP